MARTRLQVPVYSVHGSLRRHVSPSEAHRLLDLELARDISTWIHGKGRSRLALQLVNLDRCHRNDSAAISLGEMRANVGELEPHQNQIEAVRAQEKVAAWPEVRWGVDLVGEALREVERTS